MVYYNAPVHQVTPSAKMKEHAKTSMSASLGVTVLIVAETRKVLSNVLAKRDSFWRTEKLALTSTSVKKSTIVHKFAKTLREVTDAPAKKVSNTTTKSTNV